MEYYFAFKKSEIMKISGKQIIIGKIISNEVTQTIKDHLLEFSFLHGTTLRILFSIVFLGVFVEIMNLESGKGGKW